MAKTFKYDKATLFKETNHGLDILHRLITECVGCEVSPSKKFSSLLIREEKTPSCSLYKNKESWVVKDHGGEIHYPINLVMRTKGLSFRVFIC